MFEILTLYSNNDTRGAYTGLDINFDKSTLVPMNVTAQEGQALASILGCPVSNFPQIYLGLPLSPLKLRLADMQLTICKHDRHLSGWAGRLLNPAGRCAKGPYQQSRFT